MSLEEVMFTISGQAFTLEQILIIPVVLIVGYLTIRWMAMLISRSLIAREIRADLVHLIRRIFYVVALSILAITTLDLLNVPLAAFAFVSGAIAIGVGFGAQNIINNFISGWILMWEQPIRIGDFLEIDGAFGTVDSINTRSTLIRRTDGVHMLVPNSALLENTVVNWTLIDKLARTFIKVGVAYGSPVKRVRDLIQQAADEHQHVHNKPSPLVIFDDFADSSLVFVLFFWVDATGERDLRVIRSDLRFRIVELFEENDIVIAFPQQDVHIDGNITLLNPK
ncbi:MAG: small-conductance mechanosensitive channel [Chitinophagales bacterium]|jgi:small-conductance mechanosensitive channel